MTEHVGQLTDIGSHTELNPRLSTRVLIVDSSDRLLLLHTVLPDGRGLWLPPGGGIQGDETPEQAAVREVLEETGITLDSPGRRVWTRRTIFWGIDQFEHFFFTRIPELTEVVTNRNADASEQALVRGHQWWLLNEITAASHLDFVPRQLALHLHPLLLGAIPNEPYDVGL